jgi:hypothetical protein
MTLLRVAALALACSAVAAVPLRAQDAPPADSAAAPASAADSAANELRPDGWSLSFEFPAYGSGFTGQLGVWEMVGPSTNLGLVLGIIASGRDRSGDNPDFAFGATVLQLGLQARQYVGSGRVLPFVHAAASGRLSYDRVESGPQETENGMVAGVGELGMGAEWFPVPHLSIAGNTGVSFTAGRTTVTIDNGETTTEDVERHALLQTYTSRLSVQIYF